MEHRYHPRTALSLDVWVRDRGGMRRGRVTDVSREGVQVQLSQGGCQRSGSVELFWDPPTAVRPRRTVGLIVHGSGHRLGLMLHLDARTTRLIGALLAHYGAGAADRSARRAAGR